MEKEIWKNITGYENLYQVSNLGRVRTLARKTKKGIQGGISPRNPEGILNNHECTTKNREKGWQTYLQVYLTKNGKRKDCLVHRLVAQEFIKNPRNLKVVNHKNGNKHDNRAINLEWMSYSENLLHSYRSLGRKPNIPVGRKVECIETGEIFNSAREASRKYNIKNSSQIGCVCMGKRYYETAADKHWRFVE